MKSTFSEADLFADFRCASQIFQEALLSRAPEIEKNAYRFGRCFAFCKNIGFNNRLDILGV